MLTCTGEHGISLVLPTNEHPSSCDDPGGAGGWVPPPLDRCVALSVSHQPDVRHLAPLEGWASIIVYPAMVICRKDRPTNGYHCISTHSLLLYIHTHTHHIMHPIARSGSHSICAPSSLPLLDCRFQSFSDGSGASPWH
jgi:hypothetical protein